MVTLLLRSHILAPALLRYAAEIEPAFKGAHAGENVWQQEVQETPKLAQIVLKRCACSTTTVEISLKIAA